VFFTTRDTSTFHAENGPGQLFADQGAQHLAPGARHAAYTSDPPTSGPHVPRPLKRDGVRLTNDQLLSALELGDVVILYPTRALEPPLRRFADQLAGPFSAPLAAAGQAIVLDRDPRRGGITALAWRHLLRVSGAGDPALRDFANFWLGHGAGH
jgi:hypothetical protein